MAPFFLKQLLCEEYNPTLDDLQYFDSNIYKAIRTLSRMKDAKEIEELNLYFTASESSNSNFPSEIELIPGGSEVKVTQSNLDFYIKKISEFYLIRDVSIINRFKEGISIYEYNNEDYILLLTRLG